jgi:DNA-binding Lrp family transcriptional regulator
LPRVDVRIDAIDLQILKILTNDCRTSYRSIGKTLGISANTARARVRNLILNKVIEQFITLVNFSLFGYNGVLTIILKVGKNRHNIFDKVAKSIRDWGTVYQHIEIFEGIYLFSIAVKDVHISNNNIDSIKKNLSNAMGKTISILDIFSDKHTSLVSDKFHLRKIDLEILECLLSDARMTYLNIARRLGRSQKTIIRRVEKLKNAHVTIGFSLIHNPSNMKGYNYFSMVLHTQSSMATNVMKEISYSRLNEHILRLPPFIYHDRVVINFHIENIFDSESIVGKIKTINGVVKAEAYQPIRIKWHEEWLKRKIRNKILQV